MEPLNLSPEIKVHCDVSSFLGLELLEKLRVISGMVSIYLRFNERGMPCILEYLADFNCFNFMHHQDMITLEERNISHPWEKEHHLQKSAFFEGICYFPGGYVFFVCLLGVFNCFNESFVQNEDSQSTENSSCPSGICSGSSIR